MWLLILFLTTLSASCGQEVVPLLDCVIYRADTNTLLAFFGYASTYPTTVHIDVGENNFFSPGVIFRNQPTDFLPGLHQNEFATSFQVSGSQTQITWFLDGRTITAKNDSSLYCQASSNCTCPAGPPGPPGPPGPQGPRGQDGANGTFNLGKCREVVATNQPSKMQLFQDDSLPDELPMGSMLCTSDQEVGWGTPMCGLDAIAKCNPGEFLLTGSSECSFPLVLRASGELNLNSWKTSCIGIKIKRTFARATAVCCTP